MGLAANVNCLRPNSFSKIIFLCWAMCGPGGPLTPLWPTIPQVRDLICVSILCHSSDGLFWLFSLSSSDAHHSESYPSESILSIFVPPSLWWSRVHGRSRSQLCSAVPQDVITPTTASHPDAHRCAAWSPHVRWKPQPIFTSYSMPLLNIVVCETNITHGGIRPFISIDAKWGGLPVGQDEGRVFNNKMLSQRNARVYPISFSVR